MVKKTGKILGNFPFIGRSLRQQGTISTIKPGKVVKVIKPFPFVGSPLKKKGK
tara:strand:- start:389 stop:547 length:159 start_codon:yes stop_codon:yes gene_type:complete